ncbi:hypothetical protein K491DRAFT_701052 [Lophiostoma macrostomum CBS 122681]|uniref:LYC1 C-terminal domain-containing protein n=1 Tax=Lophiostoma macrostomum CBS 122681 TaxID=1314788 RepID=A0A6A6TQZ2_9PLEO|nr:hypothetical protein K491DRAFT_701052 [Lophiostoma macrostomum CBS 122681]
MGSLQDLPNGSSSDLALVHPTDEEKLYQFNLNGFEWRGALSLEAYLRREEVLSSQALTRDGGIRYWILIDTTATSNPFDPNSSLRLPLASCETYRKKALVWRDGEIEEVVSHGIGSVFCEPRLRKRGYAQRLMQEVGNALRVDQGKESLFSVLFSDIGKKFYAEYGWEPFNSTHVSIPAGKSVGKGASDLPATKALFEEDLEDLCEADEQLIRKRLAARSRGSNTAVSLIPDIETIKWHHAREDFVGKELHGKAPKIKGAVVGREAGKRAWCYFNRMWYNGNPNEAKGNTLHVLRLVVEEQCEASPTSAIAALLAVAQREAEEWKMEDVEIWNPSQTTVAAAQAIHAGAKVVDRDLESITSLKWFPPHGGPVADEIDWISNEKYGWC